ncbi:hypothetical protein HON58_02595, partial [Candidatus Peregrinibacteria bacterium]|nr:hypothetical protein [Candidatus Peregrinibacteria bacterium]
KGEEKAKVARMLLNPVQTFLTVDGATIIEGSLDTREKARMSIHKTEEIEQFGKLLKKLIRLVDADVQKKLDEEQAERLEKLGDF